MSCFQRFIRRLSPFCFRFKAPLQIHRSHPCSHPPGLAVPASVETAHGRSQIPVLCPGEWGQPACSWPSGLEPPSPHLPLHTLLAGSHGTSRPAPPLSSVRPRYALSVNVEVFKSEIGHRYRAGCKEIFAPG